MKDRGYTMKRQKQDAQLIRVRIEHITPKSDLDLPEGYAVYVYQSHANGIDFRWYLANVFDTLDEAMTEARWFTKDEREIDVFREEIARW